MGLADRFREQLKSKDIFEDKTQEEKKETVQTQLPSKVICNLDVENISKIKTYTTNVIKHSTGRVYKPTTSKEELKTAIKSKILKTPCWDDYSLETKTKMLEKYFAAKMKGQEYTLSEKNDFVNSILNNK